MDSLELKKYIKEALEFGLPKEKIVENLTEAGWDSGDIYTALGVIKLTKVDVPIESLAKEEIEQSKYNLENKLESVDTIKEETEEVKSNLNEQEFRKPIKSSENKNNNLGVIKKSRVPIPSLIPLVGVATLGVLFILGTIYSENQFSIEIDKASVMNADASSVYNTLAEEKIINKKFSKESSMLFVGDIMLSEKRGTGKQMKKNRDYDYPFLRIAHILSKADLAFGNLEGPVSSRGGDIGGTYSFRANPKVIDGLEFASFDVLSIANNHIFDWGEEAFLDTLSNLDASTIEPVGGGVNLRDSLRPVIKDVKGTKVAFIAFSAVDYDIGRFEAKYRTPGKAPFTNKKIIESIENLKKSNKADVIIVSIHWGKEYKRRSSSHQQKLAYAMIDSGADLIVGHHPHVVQEVEAYRNGWIAYSLGNFVFDQDFSKDTMEGLMLDVKLKRGKIVRVNPIPIKISDTFQPYVERI